MTTEQDLPSEIEERFYEAYLDRPEPERTHALDAVCGEFPDWAGTMRALAAHLGSTDRMLGRVRQEVERAGDPERIGPYTILEELGSGGFGVVYRAEQHAPVRRTVALKLLRPGLTNARALARFEAERQALALMDHPGIAQVFDAGATPGGQPYFAMELVDGAPITVWCEEHDLDTRARLALFLKVCAAVQHAHQKNLVHRDLKPSNVLVREQDGEPAPKVIDFGIAKALDSEAPRTLATADGALVGTPEYMSPEQAAGRPVDVRTDVYALGVLLFEILTGELPFDRTRIRTSNLAQIARIICEEEPHRPSEALPKSSRRATPELLRDLRSDLDWVVVQACAKPPDARYDSVGALAEDVQRFLDDEPVRARQHPFGYVARKFAARHRVGVAVAAAALVLVVLGVAGLVWALVQIDAARDDAIIREYTARITAADAAIKLHNVASGKKHLQRCPPELRGFEWRHLQLKCGDGRPVLAGSGFWRGRIRWVGDGSRFVTSGREGVCWWNASDGASAREPVTGVSQMDVSPDGRVLALARRSREIELRDAVSGAPIRTLRCTAPLQLTSVGFSSDGSHVVAWTAGEPRYCVFDRRDASAQRRFEGPRVYALGPEAKWGVVAAQQHTGAAIRDFATGQRRPLFGGPGERIDTAAVSHDGRLLAWCSQGTIRIHDAATGALLHQLAAHRGGLVHEVRFLGDRLLSCGEDCSVQVWNLPNGMLEETLLGADRALCAVDGAPDGRSVLGLTHYDGARTWKLDDRAYRVDLRAHAGTPVTFDSPAIAEITWNRDGTRLFTTSENGTVKLWDATTLAELDSHFVGGRPAASALDPAERLLAIACQGVPDLHAVLWEPGVGERARLRGAGRGARGIAWSPDGTRIATCGLDGVFLWHAATGRLDRAIEHPGTVRSVAFGPDGRELWSGCEDGWIRAIDLLTGAELRRCATEGAPNALLVAAGGRRLFSSEDMVLVQRSIPDGRIVQTYTGHTSWVGKFSLAIDGQRIASPAGDGTVRVWDRRSGQDLLVLEAGGWQGCAAFSPDGKRLASGGEPGVLTIWNSEAR